MKKEIIACASLLLTVSSTYAQLNQTTIECRVIEVIFNDSTVKKFFHLEKSKHHYVYIYDGTNMFKQCKSLTIAGQNYAILDSLQAYSQSTAHCVKIENLIRRHNKISIWISYEPEEKEARIEVEKKSRHYILTKKDFGNNGG